MAGAIATFSRKAASEQENPDVYALALSWERLEDGQRREINNIFRGCCAQKREFSHCIWLSDDICNAFQHLLFLCMGSLRQFWIVGPEPCKVVYFLQIMAFLKINLADEWDPLHAESNRGLYGCNKFAPAIIESPPGGQQGPGVYAHNRPPPQPEGSGQFIWVTASIGGWVKDSMGLFWEHSTCSSDDGYIHHETKQSFISLFVWKTLQKSHYLSGLCRLNKRLHFASRLLKFQWLNFSCTSNVGPVDLFIQQLSRN